MRVRRILLPSLVAAAVCVAVVEPPGLNAQGKTPARVTLKGAISRSAHAFGVTQRVDQLPPEPTASRSLPDRTPEHTRAIRNPKVRTSSPTGAGSEWTDLAVQTLAPEGAMPSASVSFEGLSSQDNANVFGFRVSPPDTNGAVGPNHYVQQTNMLVRIFTKTGSVVTTFRLSTLFASAGVCGTDDDGDPIVMYDALADRWILSQFGFASSGSPPYYQCIAVSQTGNPAGAYYAYDFLTPGSEFPDYPHLGVWPDAYYMTVNQFLNGGPFDGTGAYAFDRAKMLAGDPTASFVYFNLNLASHPEGIGGVLPSWVDGLRPPAAGAPNVFAYFLATEYGDSMDGLRLFSFHADFANPANSTFIERAESPIAVAAFDPIVADIPQPPPATSSHNLDTLRDRLMHRLQYRNTGSAETLVVTHTVNVTLPSRAGVRYYELRRTGGGAYAVAEQATFAPDSTNRWMGSAAEDNVGNLAVGYSVASSTVYPGIRFAGRLASDPPGGLFQGEASLIEGSGVQRSTSGRWGDYSGLTLDPADDCTFWYTTEYYTADSQATSTVGWLTRVGSFKYPSCTASARGTFNVTVSACSTGVPIAGAAVSIDGVLYNTTSASGQASMKVISGTYTVSAVADGALISQSATVIAGGTQAVALCVTAYDLTISSLTAGNKTGVGLSYTIKDTTANISSSTTPPSTTRFWLSNDSGIGPGDTSLATRLVPALAGGAVSKGTTTVVIPAIAPGSYYLIARADDGNLISEASESNNTRSRKVLIGPDLRIAYLNAPFSATRGAAISIEDNTTNAGGGSTGVAFITRYYLSKNATADAGDVVLASRTVGVLAPGDSSFGSATVTIPASVASGSYYVIAVADATGVVAESSEKNNKRTSSIFINP